MDAEERDAIQRIWHTVSLHHFLQSSDGSSDSAGVPARVEEPASTSPGASGDNEADALSRLSKYSGWRKASSSRLRSVLGMFAPDAEAPRSAVLQACEKLCDSQRPAELGRPCRYEKRKAMHRLRALVWVESANRCTELFGKLTRAKLEDEVMKVVRLRFRQQNQDIQLRLLRGEDVSADMLLSFEDPLVPRADLPADDVAAVEAENAEPADGDAEGENGYPLAKPKLNDKENGVRVLTARRLPELSAIIKAELPNYDNKLHEDELRKRARQEFNRLSRHDQWDLARQDLRSLAPRGEDRGRFISRDAEKDMLGIP